MSLKSAWTAHQVPASRNKTRKHKRGHMHSLYNNPTLACYTALSGWVKGPPSAKMGIREHSSVGQGRCCLPGAASGSQASYSHSAAPGTGALAMPSTSRISSGERWGTAGALSAATAQGLSAAAADKAGRRCSCAAGSG